MKQFELNVGSKKETIHPYWKLCVGSCHGTTALREDYRRQLTKCQRELGFRYVRFHGLLDDDMSVLTNQNMFNGSGGEYKVSFTNVDSVFDFLLSINMKPFVEIGFMPECLKSKDTTIFHYKGNTSAPADYEKWDWFMRTFAEHLIDRYGLDEVRQWFFEVWNEPNLGGPDSPFGFWAGTMEDYFELYEHTAKALKSVDARLKVGGPSTSNNAWIPEFVHFCKEHEAPVDFVSTHHYPTDVVLGYGVEDSKNFVSMKEGETPEEFMKRRMEFQKTIWQYVDRGVLTKMTKKAVQEAEGLPVYYTEWNSGAGIQSDGPFGASFILKTVLDSVGLVEGYSYWTFSDIFEEGGMPYKPFHGGFGLLNLAGIPKATYRAYELLNALGSQMYESGLHEGTVDLYAFHKEEASCVQVLAVNHQSLLHDIETEAVKVSLKGITAAGKGGTGSVRAEIIRLDGNHGNALQAWIDMGSPDYPTEKQQARLKAASYVEREKLEAELSEDGLCVSLELPAQGAALINFYL